MGFLKDFFRGVFLGATTRDPVPAPTRVEPIRADDSPEEALKKAGLAAAEQLAFSALQIYLRQALERIPSRSKQLDVLEALQEYLDGYRDILIDLEAGEALEEARAEAAPMTEADANMGRDRRHFRKPGLPG